MINVGDVAVTWMQTSLNSDLGLLHTISHRHPFPILERYVSHCIMDHSGNKIIVPANTQLFIPLESMPVKNVLPLAFGAGKRVCTGKQYALTAMKPMFDLFFTQRDYVQPEHNHRFSGRNNDANQIESYIVQVAIIWYQIRLLVSISWMLLIQNLKR